MGNQHERRHGKQTALSALIDELLEKEAVASIKQPLDASPNSPLFGNATIQEPGMMEEMATPKTNQTTRAYIDEFTTRQGKLLNAARKR